MYAVTSIEPEMRTRATLRSAELGFFGVVVYTRVHTPRRCGAATFFLRPLPDFRPGVASFFLGAWRPLRTSCDVVGMRSRMVAGPRPWADGPTTVAGSGRRGGGGHASRRRHERRGDDHHHEGQALSDDAERAGRHRIAEHDDPTGDAGDVRRGTGDGDDRNGFAVL